MVISSASTSAAPLVFGRPSRYGGTPHRVTVDAVTLRPLACTCAAFAYGGNVCWAVLEVLQQDLPSIATERWRQACGEVDIRGAAAILGQVRRWARAAHELQALRAGADLAQHFAEPANYAHAAALAAYQPGPAA